MHVALLRIVLAATVGFHVAGAQVAAGAATFDPTSRYDAQDVEGWRVLVNRALVEQAPEKCREALQLLRFQLHDVVRRVPAGPVAKLRQIPIWLELKEPHHPCAAYHPDVAWLRGAGMNPDKARCVEIANVDNFLSWTRAQPMMVLHELAHGYHDRFLNDGYRNAEVAACYERAKQSGGYDRVLSHRQEKVRAYALTTPMEYFAESSEAFFGTNDFYPFVAAELAAHDPDMHALLAKVWETAPRGEKRPRLVIVAADDEYQSERTLPIFAEKFLKNQFQVDCVFPTKDDPNRLENLDRLEQADVALFAVRRRVLPTAQLEVIRNYLKRGKPLVALRTTSHAFASRDGRAEAGRAQWPTFDRDVLGVSYQGHFDPAPNGQPSTLLALADGAAGDPLLQGVDAADWTSAGTLYRSRELDGAARPLLLGRTAGVEAPEPVAWTTTTPWKGKVFYTSLGHPHDFETANFQRLLRNALGWASEK